MIGLLYKDLFYLRKSALQILIILALCAFLFGQGSSFLAYMIIIVLPMIIMNTFAYDEISKWDYYALSLPVTKRGIVLARYLLTTLLGLLSAVVAGIPLFFQKQNTAEGLIEIYAVFAAALMFCALLLPLLYRFGTQKARLWLLVICLLPAVVMLVCNHMGVSFPTGGISDSAVLTIVWLSLPAALILLVLSYFISCSIVEKKEL